LPFLQSLYGMLLGSRGKSSARKSKKRKRAAAERVSGASFAPAGDGTISVNPKILIADFSSDSGGKTTSELTDILSRSETCEVFRARRVLKPGKTGTLVEQLYSAFEEGHGWLKDENADLLIWGSVNDGVAEIRFIPASPASDSQPGTFGLGNVLTLASPVTDGLDAVLAASSLAAIGPGYRGARGRLGETLGKALQDTKKFLQEKPPSLSADHYATLLTCIANGFAVHAILGNKTKRLSHAVTAYRIALKQISAESSPVIWALAQSHLASALRSMGDREKDPERHKESAAAYKKITESLSRIDQPFDWALAHINHGLVLYRLGAKSGQAAYFQESSKSFEEALSVYTKEIMPGRWAEVTNQYGVVLMALGELVTGNVTLELAVKRFRMSLEIRKRERVPLLWAQTANNLGAACFSLAKRNSEVALLREAATCFEGATDVYKEAGEMKKAEIIESNRARVERLLSARNG